MEAGSLEASETPSVTPTHSSSASPAPPKKPGAFSLLKKLFGNKFLRFGLITVVAVTLIVVLVLLWWSKRHISSSTSQAVNDQFSTTTVPLNVGGDGSVELNQKQVSVNGNVRILGDYTLVPSERPSNPVPGQQYIDNKDFRLYVFNGKEWVSQLNVADLNSLNVNIANNLQVANAQITNLQAQTATIGSVANQAATAPPFALPGETTLQGNTFNGANNLLQLNNLGLVSDSLLSGNVTLAGNTFNGANQLLQLTGGGLLPALDASNLLNLNASNISSGTLADGRLSANVALLDRASQIFTGDGQFFRGSTASAFQLQSAVGTPYFFGDSSGLRVGVGALGTNVKLNVQASDKIALHINQTGSDDIIQLASGGTNVATVSNTGTTLFKNTTDSTTAFSVQTSGGGTAFNVDTSNSRVSINKSSASYPLEVGGSIGIDNTGNTAGIGLFIGGTQVCNFTGCLAAGGSGGINNNTSIQANANIAISGNVLDATNPTARIRQYAGQTTPLLQVEDSAAAKIFTVDTTGVNIAAKPDKADTNYARYKAPAVSTNPNIWVGTYNGDGTASQNVTLPTSWGQPQALFVTRTGGGDRASCYWLYARTKDMNATRALHDGGSVNSSGIISALTTNGYFTVGNSTYTNSNCSNTLNTASRTYSYMVLRTADNSNIDGHLAVGTYTNDNVSGSRTVCINGGTPPTCSGTYTWKPDMVMILRSGGISGDLSTVWTTTQMQSQSSGSSMAQSGSFISDAITSLGNGKFVVGNNNVTNALATPGNYTYYYIAFKEYTGYLEQGQYIGTNSPQNITTGNANVIKGISFQPDFVYTKVDNGTFGTSGAAQYRMTGMGANESNHIQGNSVDNNPSPGDQCVNSPFACYPFTNAITGFLSPGFSVGTNNYANYDDGLAPSDNYHFWAAKNYKATDVLDGYASGVVYNGSFYAATKVTDSSEIYKYTGSYDGWTRVSSAAGVISNESYSGNQFVDQVQAMKVYDNKLFVGTDTGSGQGKGGIFYYNGSTWKQVNTTLGSLDGVTTGIDGISSMSVVGGQLYVATKKNNAAEVYRYEGGEGAAVFTKISDSTAGKVIGSDSAEIDSLQLINYANRLYAASQTGIDAATGHAALYYFDGGSWSMVNGTRGTFQSTASIDGVTAMTVYNGALILGTGSAQTAAGSRDKAEIYRYRSPSGGASGTGSFERISYGLGQISSAGTTGVDRIGALRVYNGMLLAASDNNNSTTGDTTGSGLAAVYQFKDVDSNSSSNRSWSIIGTQGEGNFGGASGTNNVTGVDGILFMAQYNDKLFLGNSAPANGYVFSITKNASQSYGLNFSSGSDGSYDNIGSFSFISSPQAGGNSSSTGQFLLSHGLTTSAGAYDIAEDYQTNDDELKPGDVVAIDPDKPTAYVRRADLSKGDGLRLLGIYSTHPAFRLSQKEEFDESTGAQSVPVALAGRVPVRIDPNSEPIKPGDLLTASPRPGMAVKDQNNGFIIAKALESWEKGSDKTSIEVFVTNSVSARGEILPDQDKYELALRDGKISLLDAFSVTADGGWRFLKNINFIGKVIFHDDVTFKGRLWYEDQDFAGYAVVEAGDQKVKIKYKKPYSDKPVVSVSPKSPAQYHVEDETPDGFVIKLDQPLDKKVEFSWTALQIKDTQSYNSKDNQVTN